MRESQPYGLRLSAIMRLTEVDLHSSRECWVAARGEGGLGRGKGFGKGVLELRKRESASRLYDSLPEGLKNSRNLREL